MGRILGVIVLGLCFLQQPAAAGYLLNDGTELTRLSYQGRSRFYSSREHIVQVAENARRQPIPLLTDKLVAPPSGDKKDYVSLGSYYWPNLNLMEGEPYIYEDGRVNPEREDLDRYDGRRMQVMVGNLRALARGYAVSHQEKFAERAMDLVDAWFLSSATRMNPHILYAQSIPGLWHGDDAGILDTVLFLEVLDDLEMLDGSKAYTRARKDGLRSWFGAYAEWLRTSPQGKAMGAARNGQGVWYDAQVAAFSRFAGHEDIAKDVLRAVPMRRMEGQIAEDGSLPMELSRTRPMHYSISTLQGYLVLARMGTELGVDLYAVQLPNGASLALAIEYILPYVQGEKIAEPEDVAEWSADAFLLSLHVANQYYHRATYEVR